MAVMSELRVVIAFIDSLKFSRTDIIREISVYVIGCLCSEGKRPQGYRIK